MLKKDMLELCLLELVGRQDCYGYAILDRLHAVFPSIQESVIYAHLRGLSKEGCIEVYLGGTSGGPARKYYRLTESGRTRRGELLCQWRELREAMDSLIGTE